MIAVSAALVLAALGLLVAGIIVPYMVLVYLSIGVSVLAALLLGAGAFQRRGEFFTSEAPASAEAQGDTEQVVTAAKADTLPGAKPTETRPASHGTATSASRPEPATPEAAVEAISPKPANATIPADAPVSVTPARRTYHLASCRQLRGRASTRLTYGQAREEGYTACTSCLPDTVLAARGEAATAAPSDDEDTLTMQAAGFPRASGGTTAEASPETSTATPTAVDEADDDQADDVQADSSDRDDVTPAGTDDSGFGESEGQAGLVCVVEGSHRYHRLTCAVVEDAVQDGIELTTMGCDEAEDAQCTPCTVCRP